MSSQPASQPTIPADWIAYELGLSPHSIVEWADRLGLEHRTDESLRECLTEPDGRRIIDEVRRVGREAAELHAAYESYVEDWERQRRQAGEEAFQRGLLSAYQRERSASMPKGYAFVGGSEMLGPSPQTRAFAGSEAEEARVAWARKHPRMDFEQFEKKWKRGRR
jgi:hypothetical protein